MQDDAGANLASHRAHHSFPSRPSQSDGQHLCALYALPGQVACLAPADGIR